jgi:SAM-dependent methyltransferase
MRLSAKSSTQSAPISDREFMARPFVQDYDLIYADKDYDKDIEAFQILAGMPSLTGTKVLEVGAGTGNHTVRLALKVGELVSVEVDSDFVEVLRGKIAAVGGKNTKVFDRPIEYLTESEFDAAGAFFHVLNYISPDRLESFFSALAGRLRSGARFVADAWNGAAVMLDPPREEIRRKTAGTTQIVQRIRPRTDVTRRRVSLDYEIDLESEGGTKKIIERIELYLWLREELQAVLQRVGFSDVAFWDYRLFPARARPESLRLWVCAVRN